MTKLTTSEMYEQQKLRILQKPNSNLRIDHKDEVIIPKTFILASIITNLISAAIIFHAYIYLI